MRAEGNAPAPTGMGTFYGLGVGPGPAGLLPLRGAEVLARTQVLYAPRATVSEHSVALAALGDLPLDHCEIRDVEFLMDGDDERLHRQYTALADDIAGLLERGLNVSYITIGDAMTYSTLGYLSAALRHRAPQCPQEIVPGVTSYAAAAALSGFSLGEAKERVLILPCPDDLDALRRDILSHDIVVLMKVGRRMAGVLEVLRELGIADHCALAHRIGLDGEYVTSSLADPDLAPGRLGYLSVLLIRRQPPQRFV